MSPIWFDFLCYLEQRTEEILPGVIWRVWKRDVSLHGRSLNAVSAPSATCAIFQKKISRWFGRENPNPADVVIPFVQKRQDQQRLRCQFVRGFVSFSSVSLCYRASLPTVTHLDKLCWFSAFFSIMQLTFPAFLVLLEGNAIFPLRSLSMRLNKVCQLQVCVGAVSTNDSYSQLGHRKVWFFLLGLWYMSRFKDSCT